MEEELINALKRIKKECESHTRCEHCPMRKQKFTTGSACYLKDKNPSIWNLKNEKPVEIPRVFWD